MSYEQDQARWLEETGVKVGDRVRVIIQLTPGEDEVSGWGFGWTNDMKVGDVGRVLAIHPTKGIRLPHKEGWRDQSYPTKGFFYPFFVLIKI